MAEAEHIFWRVETPGDWMIQTGLTDLKGLKHGHNQFTIYFDKMEFRAEPAIVLGIESMRYNARTDRAHFILDTKVQTRFLSHFTARLEINSSDPPYAATIRWMAHGPSVVGLTPAQREANLRKHEEIVARRIRNIRERQEAEERLRNPAIGWDHGGFDDE